MNAQLSPHAAHAGRLDDPHAAAAWAATGDALALLDAPAGRILWRTPGFDTLLGGLHAEVADLCEAWPMLADALAEAGQGGGVRRLNLPAPPVAAEGDAAWVAEVYPGLQRPQVCLRLRPDGGELAYVQRQIQDRERMVYTSRTLSVGEMATTLAHELNQPLGTITNVLHGLRRRLEAPPEAGLDRADLLHGVQMAMDQAQFAARVIARIRSHTFSRPPVREPLDLPELVRECLGLLDADLQHLGVRAVLQLEPAATGARTRGDAVMLQQVLINLMRNALDAMRSSPPGARHLTLHLKHQPPLTRGLVAEWILQLSDTGCGIDHDTEGRLFTPFVSTKPNGMGIGLNLCRSFVELHEGRLWFTRNAPAPGCTFHVALPVDPAPETPR